MEEPEAQEPNNQEEIKIVIESLYDTFVKYLNPDLVISSDSWIDEHKGDFVQNQSSRETAVQNLMGWILEDDVFETAVSHFTAALKKLTHESDALHPAISGGTDDEKLEISQCIKHLIYMLDGSLMQKLPLNNMKHVLNIMLDNKIITEKICQQAKGIENSHECCLLMLKNIKKGKPDWPLVFFRAVMTKNPDLMQPQKFNPGQQNEISQATPATLVEIDTSSKNQPEDIFTPSTLYSNSELDNPLDGFSEFTSSSASTKYRMTYMPEDQLKSLEIQILINSGNLDPTTITSDPSFENQNRRRRLTSSHEFSDEEDDDEQNFKTTHLEETPGLNLREYQKELAENALKGRNTIICAPTGSGKTRVATHIIRDHLEKRADNEERKVAFLARTVPLVLQQCKSLKKYLPKKFEVTSLTGDSEDSMHLHMILPDNHVIVMTPRILENHLKKGCLPHLGVFSMLVFDECHHTRKGEPYNTLMYSYLKTKKQISEAEERGEVLDIKLPQIVGLTASISVEKAVQDEEAVKCILQVCGNLDADSISCVVKNEAELKQTVPVPEEKLSKLREIENDEAVERIIRIMKKLEAAIIHHSEEIKSDELKALLKKVPNDKKSQQYGQWAVKIRNVAKAFPRKENRETIGSVRALIITAKYLSAYNVALELHDLVLLEHVLAYLDKCFFDFSQNKNRSQTEDNYFDSFSEFKDLMKSRLHTENPNLTHLKEILSKYLIAKGEKSCGIIFVRTRALTEALASWLNTCDDPELRNLKATVFTGTAATVEEGGMTTTEQDEVLQSFKSGAIRLLVATSVGEEGIDIPECNLVIKYNHVGNEVTTVQTRGRSRKEGGMSILLAMDKIIRKERINQEKAKMMVRAIKEIRQMKRSKIRRMNKVHQQQIMNDEEIHQIVRQQEESHLLRKDFKMVCHLCRKVVIDSKDIKTIFQTHRVVVNRNILKQTKTIPYKDAKYIDEIRMIGSVRCMGEPEEGKRCYNKLGSMMVYSKVPFVVLGIQYFGFDSNGPLGLEFYNKWKKVPYAIDEIGPADFERYLPDKKIETVDDGHDDDDEDSDENSDDDDKGDKPPRINVEPDGSSSIKQAQAALSDNLGSNTEQKRVLSSVGVNNSDGVSTTELKRLQGTSDSHGDRDSGIFNSGASTEGSKFSSSSTHSSTQLKQAAGHANSAVGIINKNEDLSSVQLSGISSFKSRETLHRTTPMPMSQVHRSEMRIENHRFRVAINDRFNEGPPLSSNISDFQAPVLNDGLPSVQCSEVSESEELSNILSNNDAESRAEASGNIPDNHEDSTMPKEVLPERNENITLRHEQSRQNVDDGSIQNPTGQPFSGLNLL